MVQITPVMGVLITSMALGIEKPWQDPTFTESKAKAARTWGYLVLFGDAIGNFGLGECTCVRGDAESIAYPSQAETAA